MAHSEQLEFHGLYFDGRSSQAHGVVCTVDHGRLAIRSRSGATILQVGLALCTLTPPLGASRRFLKFPGGERLEVAGPAVIFFEDHLHGHRGLRFVHVIESQWRFVAASLAGLILCVWAFVAFAIPQLAAKVASATPVGLMNSISDDSLQFLDERFLAPSALPPPRQDEVEKVFKALCADFSLPQGGVLVFRKGGDIGANAFALPSGQVVITDELVDFVKSDEELAGVLAHELVHVQERHGLRHVVQQAGVVMVISTLLGDMTSLSSLASTLPMMLVESGYSRQFEKEADENACRYFLGRGRSVKPYQDLLYRLTKDEDLPGVASFLASHPDPGKRLQAIDECVRMYQR